MNTIHNVELDFFNENNTRYYSSESSLQVSGDHKSVRKDYRIRVEEYRIREFILTDINQIQNDYVSVVQLLVVQSNLYT